MQEWPRMIEVIEFRCVYARSRTDKMYLFFVVVFVAIHSFYRGAPQFALHMKCTRRSLLYIAKEKEPYMSASYFECRFKYFTLWLFVRAHYFMTWLANDTIDYFTGFFKVVRFFVLLRWFFFPSLSLSLSISKLLLSMSSNAASHSTTTHLLIFHWNKCTAATTLHFMRATIKRIRRKRRLLQLKKKICIYGKMYAIITLRHRIKQN